MINFGIGCHHVGMSFQERNAVEQLFQMGCLTIVIASYTLGNV